MMLINAGNTRRIEILTDNAFRRGGFFALKNKCGARALQGIIETTAAWDDVVLKTGKRLLRFAGFHPDGLIGNDFR